MGKTLSILLCLILAAPYMNQIPVQAKPVGWQTVVLLALTCFGAAITTGVIVLKIKKE